MKYYRYEQEFTPAQAGTAVAIGNFDGVHRGHQYIIAQQQKIAAEKKLYSVVLTFDPHPAKFHRPEESFSLITTTEQKCEVLESLKVEATMVLEYNQSLVVMSPEEFCTTVLVQKLNARAVIVGEDFTFGKGRIGTAQTLQALGKKLGFTVLVLQDQSLKIKNHPLRRFSSTWLREVLADGDVATAAKILGRYHRVEGNIVHGAARGRELGFPTANLEASAQGLIPADGVYAGWLTIAGQSHPAAISLGLNPTFKGLNFRQIEAHVINRPVEKVEDFDLYDQYARIEFVEYIRPMVAYTGVQDLIKQITIDVKETERILDAA